MSLVKAQCTSCGGVLEVDNTKDAAICPYCKTPYIVEKAVNLYNVSNKFEINNAHINIVGNDVESMVADADALLNKLNQTKRAYEKYEQISKMFPRDYRGWWGMAVCKIKDGYSKSENKNIMQNIDRAKALFPEADKSFARANSEYIHYSLEIKKISDENEVLSEKMRYNDGPMTKIYSIILFFASIIAFFAALYTFFTRLYVLAVLSSVFLIGFFVLLIVISGRPRKNKNLLEKLTNNKKEIAVLEYNLWTKIAEIDKEIKS